MEITESISIALIAGVFSFLGMIVVPTFNIVVAFFKKRKQGVTENFIKKKQDLQQKITALALHLDCQRVSICMLHNGGNYYTGESVKRLSMVAEYVKKGSRPALLETQGILMTPYIRSLNKLFTQSFVFEADTALEHDLLSRINEEYDIKSSLVLGIFRKKPKWMFWKENKRMVAFIHIGWDVYMNNIDNSDLLLILNQKDNIYKELVELSKDI